MEAEDVTLYLHRHIPMSAAIGARVLECRPGEVLMHAPLDPNLNHRGTAFGGSLATLGILAAWTLLHLSLRASGLEARLVIQKSETDYAEPVHEDFTALSRLPGADWDRFRKMLERYGRARIAVQTEIRAGGAVAVRHEGTFVALR